jgi:hypothetical protein
MPWVMLAMLAAQAVKHYAVDKPQEDAKREQMAAAQQYGPWINGFKGGGKADTYDPTQRPDLLSGLMQAGVGGYMQDQNVGDHQLMEQYRKLQLEKLKKEMGGAGSGADALTSSYYDSHPIGSSAAAGFDGRMDPTQNPWGTMGDSMTEGMGEGAQNPWLWDTAGIGATA